ncbi:hypothetical protein ACN2CC_16445 [Mesorhizobium muleiense]|uniref:hypothetical protein n=1 Tax=Mesorhizobium TaxID=68287 RepID=UPI000FE49BC9|nr:hypothetical protein [Mesorhizobium sp.]RWO30542.1 MAG: hypothetical protein EOS10_18775 [Mesorhizobium sp.]TIN79060.1 MAG: hypothetical protein E5Y09_10440 [Mesorhizobium sp.]
MRRFAQVAGLGIGLAALVLQICITVQASMAAGRSFVGSLVFYFSAYSQSQNGLRPSRWASAREMPISLS